MKEFIKSDLEFEDDELFWLVERLRDCFNKNKNNFNSLCETIYNIWSYCKNNYWKAKNNEYYNSYKLLAKFGFDKKAVNRYKQCYEKFVVDNTISKVVKDFAPSKLFELLSLSKNTIIELIDKQIIVSTMTVKEIRECIKILKYGTDKVEQVVENTIINENNIPMAYDPKKEYAYSYFEEKTKNQLLNIVWELQKAYQKIIKEKNKKND